MAKTRAQRKAERRAREAQEQRQAKRAGRDDSRDGRDDSPVERDDSSSQHDTQVPISGEVAEVTAVEVGMQAGAAEADLETPDAPKAPPKPSRAERRAAERERKQQERKAREDEKRRERERIEKREKRAAEERQRGRVLGFIASCWAELKRVQWPDRDTLVQASAVTLVFVAIAAAYLGALDALFSWAVNLVL
jgi:preprotein translocase subunit SecE